MFDLNPPPYEINNSDSLPDYTSGAQVIKNANYINSQTPTISVELDSPESTYRLGDIITGKIIITPKSNIHVKSVYAVLEGEEIASKSRWVNTCSPGTCASTTFKIDSFTIPSSSLPEDHILKRKFKYIFPFSIQNQTHRSKAACSCKSEHSIIPSSFSHTIAGNSSLGVGTGSGFSSTLNRSGSHEISSPSNKSSSKLSYSTGGPKISISYRVSAHIQHTVGNREVIFSNDFLRDSKKATVNIMASYLPDPEEASSYTVGGTRRLTNNNNVQLEIATGTNMIMSMNPKDQLEVSMDMKYLNFENKKDSMPFAPSPKNISSQLICRTYYSTNRSNGSYPFVDKPVEFAVNLAQKWLSVDDPNESNNMSQFSTSMAVGFSVPAALARSKLIVPTFQSCLIKREYFLKMCVRTTDSPSTPLELTVPVYVVASLSTPLSASTASIDVEESLAYSSFGISHPSTISLPSSESSYSKLSRSNSQSSNSSFSSFSNSSVASSIQPALSTLSNSDTESSSSSGDFSISRSSRNIFRSINSNINEMLSGVQRQTRSNSSSQDMHPYRVEDSSPKFISV